MQIALVKNRTIQFQFALDTEWFGKRNRNRPANIIDDCIFVQCKITYDDGHVNIVPYQTVSSSDFQLRFSIRCVIVGREESRK